MLCKKWCYNINENNTAINVSSVVRFYPEIRKIGIFLAFYRYNQFINAECWIDENSNSFENSRFKKEANLINDKNLEIHMADWLDNRVKAKYDFIFYSKRFSIEGVEKSYPDLFRAIQKFVWDEVYS